jgi:hypothetical protein
MASAQAPFRYPAGMSPEDQRALEDFAASKVTLNEIRGYLRAGDGSVQPGSILGVDDQLWPHHPTSQVVWVAMISASEHLDIIEAILEMAPKRTFVTAPYSVVRGALVGAAQALWILGAPNPVDRQQRSLSIGIEYLSQRIGYQVEQLKVCSEEQKIASQAQIDKLLLPMLAEAQSKRKKGYRYNDTQVIATAAGYCFTENSANVVTTIDLHWRRLGGDAHALGWQLLFGNLTWSGDNSSELSPVVLTGKVGDVVETASWAFHFLKKAVEQHKLLSAANS